MMVYSNKETTSCRTAAYGGWDAMTTAHYMRSLDATAATASSAERRRRCTVVTALLVILGALIVAAFVALMLCAVPMKGLFVGIDGVSGLDGRLDPAAALSTTFNLTLRVASGSYGRRACVEPGTYLEVAYRCVKLATTTASAALCAGPRRSAEQRLVATGSGVRVPGHLLDSLAQEQRQGAARFGVTVRWSGDDGQPEDKWVASCGGRRVGGGSGGAECDTDDSAWYHSCSGRANAAVAASDDKIIV